MNFQAVFDSWAATGVAVPSFQSLFLRFRFGDTILATGSGFLVQTHVGLGLITARHNLTGVHQHTGDCLHRLGGIPDNVEIVHNGIRPLSNVSKIERLFAESGEARWIEHPELGDKCDVVVLPLTNLKDVFPVPYGVFGPHPDIAVKPTEQVSVIGFPMSHTAGAMLAIWCSGYVASEPSLDYAGQPQFLIDCRTRKGQSGSPVIAFRNGPYATTDGSFNVGGSASWRPLGVYTGRIHEDADIGVVWKWPVVEALKTEMAVRIARQLQSTMITFGASSPELKAALKTYGFELSKSENEAGT